MNNLDCNVIKDLMPSYIDGICSENSKVLVEDHLLGCKDCKKIVEMMKQTEIVANKTNIKEIDYMKKVKKYFINKNIIILCLLIGFVVTGTTIVISYYGNVPLGLYYVILPVLMLGSYFVLSHHTVKKTKSKWKVIIGSLSMAFICYCIFIEIMTVKWVQSNIYPFGMEAVKVGPFIYNQFLIIAICQIAIFIGTIMISLKKESNNNILLGLSITGSCLTFSFISILKNMKTIESFVTIRNNSLLIILLEGILLIAITSILNRKKIIKQSSYQ